MSRIVVVIALLLSPLVMAEPTALFDGQSLSGWQFEGDVPWAVTDGAMVAEGSGQSFLSSDAEFGDFYLRAEFWVDATTNSGLFIRCRDRSRIYPDTCYELNIYDQHPKQEARTGAIVFVVMPPLAQVETVGHWNTYEVTARGPHIEVKVNGVITAVLEDANPVPGFIALQHWEKGTVKFRKLEISPL
jgi:hypothetical protein